MSTRSVLSPLMYGRMRIVAAFWLLALIVQALASVVIYRALSSHAEHEAAASLGSGARLFKHLAHDNGSPAQMASWLTTVQQVTGLRAVAFQHDAHVGWKPAAGALPANLPPAVARELVRRLDSMRAAAATGAARTSAGEPPLWDLPGTHWRAQVLGGLPSTLPASPVLAVLLTPVDQPLSTVVGRATDAASRVLPRMIETLVLLAVVFLALFAWLGITTANWVARPLADLAEAARRVQGGIYEGPLPQDGLKEVRAVSAAFEQMRRAIAQRERQIRDLACTDTLTALPNRMRFRSELKREIEQTRRIGRDFSVLLLDLDRFKRINDVLGPRYGDHVLREVAARVRHALGSNDVLARLGGDEFGVLLPNHRIDGAQAAAARIMMALRAPGQIGEHLVDISASVGIAVCPDHGTDADRLIGRAEQAMLEAKRSTGGVMVYRDEFGESQDCDLGMLTELRRAVDVNQLRLVLQPKVHLSTGELVGAEALVRWMHPERGELLPTSFIPFAEQTGVIGEITRWMTQRSLLACRRMRKNGVPLRVSINLSTRDLLNRELTQDVAKMIERIKVKPEWLVFEITESVLMEDPERARRTLDELHELGVGLSIDDFGTGYSSLGYLKRLPVDELKIDRSFVMNMDQDVHDAKIVRSTIDLAHNLGLRVVAEGLESERHWRLLGALNCDEAQGYFVSRPLHEDDFLAWAEAWTAPKAGVGSMPTLYADLV